MEAYIAANAKHLHEIQSRRARDVHAASEEEDKIIREIKALCKLGCVEELDQLTDDFETDVKKPRAKKACLEGEIEKWSVNPRYFKKVADLKMELREVEEEIERLERRLQNNKQAVSLHGSNARCRLLQWS